VEVWCTGSSQAAAAAAAEFICHEKKIHVYINVKDRRAARKGSSTYYVINLYAILDFPFVIKRHQAPTPPPMMTSSLTAFAIWHQWLFCFNYPK